MGHSDHHHLLRRLLHLGCLLRLVLRMVGIEASVGVAASAEVPAAGPVVADCAGRLAGIEGMHTQWEAVLLPGAERVAHFERRLLDLHASMAMVFEHRYHHAIHTPKTAGLQAVEPAHGFGVQALVHVSRGQWPGAVDSQPNDLLRSGAPATVGQMHRGWSQCILGL